MYVYLLESVKQPGFFLAKNGYDYLVTRNIEHMAKLYCPRDAARLRGRYTIVQFEVRKFELRRQV